MNCKDLLTAAILALALLLQVNSSYAVRYGSDFGVDIPSGERAGDQMAPQYRIERMIREGGGAGEYSRTILPEIHWSENPKVAFKINQQIASLFDEQEWRAMHGGTRKLWSDFIVKRVCHRLLSIKFTRAFFEEGMPYPGKDWRYMTFDVNTGALLRLEDLCTAPGSLDTRLSFTRRPSTSRPPIWLLPHKG